MIGTGCTLGRVPRTKETLPDFHEWCRVTRHPRIFRGLTGCQRTPRKWGVTNFHALLNGMLEIIPLTSKAKASIRALSLVVEREFYFSGGNL